MRPLLNHTLYFDQSKEVTLEKRVNIPRLHLGAIQCMNNPSKPWCVYVFKKHCGVFLFQEVVKRIAPSQVLGPAGPLEAQTPSLRAHILLWFQRTQLPRLQKPGCPLPCWLHGFATRRFSLPSQTHIQTNTKALPPSVHAATFTGAQPHVRTNTSA